MLKKFDTILDFLCRLELWAGSLILFVIIMINTLNLLSRWFLRNPYNWVLEISLLLFVYTTLLLVPVLLHRKEFITMNLINEYVGEKKTKVISIFAELTTLCFFAYLLPVSLKLSLGQINVLSRGLGYPRIYLSIIVPISACLCLPVGISKIIHLYHGNRPTAKSDA